MQTKVVEKTIRDEEGFIMKDGGKMFSHKITIEGVEYTYISKSSELTAFEAGKEANFTTEVKTMSNGKPMNKIKPAEEPKKFGGGGGFSGGGNKYPAKDDAQIAMMSCLSSAATHAQGSSRPWGEVLKNAGEAYEIVKSKKGDFK